MNRPQVLAALGFRFVLPFLTVGHRQTSSQPSLVFLRALAQRVLEPGVEAAGLDTQAPTHGADRKQQAVLGDERVLHFASLAKYPAAFFRMSRSSVTRCNSRFSRRTSAA